MAKWTSEVRGGQAMCQGASAVAAAALDGSTMTMRRLTLYSMPQVRFPRRTLEQRFAVLLMQSCYRAADALDFVPMVRAPEPLGWFV